MMDDIEPRAAGRDLRDHQERKGHEDHRSGEPSTVQTWLAAKETVVRYAGAAQDFNLIHLDDDAARTLGFDGAVVHGMLTLGQALASLVDEHGPQAIRTIRARFSAPLLVDDEAQISWARSNPEACEVAVTDSSRRTVMTSTVRVAASGPSLGDSCGPGDHSDADAVVRRLVVERGAASRFAEAVGARSEIFYHHDAARRAGYASIPVVPTFVFALPYLGFFPDLPGNERAHVPAAVPDSQAWARTDGSVAHATQQFEFSRALLVGETVLTSSWVVGRSSKVSRSGRVLHFTQVRSLVTEPGGSHVATAEMGLVVIENQHTDAQQEKDVNDD